MAQTRLSLILLKLFREFLPDLNTERFLVLEILALTRLAQHYALLMAQTLILVALAVASGHVFIALLLFQVHCVPSRFQFAHYLPRCPFGICPSHYDTLLNTIL